MMIKDSIGDPALLEQFAEECNELVQASLKYARKLRGENPTPKMIDEIREDFWGEIADVFVCIDGLESAHLIDHRYVNDVKEEKIRRWYERIKEREYERKNGRNL